MKFFCNNSSATIADNAFKTPNSSTSFVNIIFFAFLAASFVSADPQHCNNHTVISSCMHAVKLAIHLKWQQQLAVQLPFPKILLKEKSLLCLRLSTLCF